MLQSAQPAEWAGALRYWAAWHRETRLCKLLPVDLMEGLTNLYIQKLMGYELKDNDRVVGSGRGAGCGGGGGGGRAEKGDSGRANQSGL